MTDDLRIKRGERYMVPACTLCEYPAECAVLGCGEAMAARKHRFTEDQIREAVACMSSAISEAIMNRLKAHR